MTMTVRVIGINYIQLLIHKNFIFPAHGQAKNFWLVCALEPAKRKLQFLPVKSRQNSAKGMEFFIDYFCQYLHTASRNRRHEQDYRYFAHQKSVWTLVYSPGGENPAV